MCDGITEIVAIDGPAGAGKSSVAKQVAKKLGFAFLDTGATYRAATWWALERGVDLDDAEAIVASTRALPLEMHEEPNGIRVLVDGQDVSEAIRTPEITRQISKLDHNPLVRAELVELQRKQGALAPTVAEGRDLGTVVFPKARCKVYMDASLEVRAQRRALQLEQKGLAVDMAQLAADIRDRDHRDMTRDVSPLRRADDAVLIDTSDMTFEQAVDVVVSLACEIWPEAHNTTE